MECFFIRSEAGDPAQCRLHAAAIFPPAGAGRSPADSSTQASPQFTAWARIPSGIPSSSNSSETLPGSALGRPAYMSPEQARGELDRLGASPTDADRQQLAQSHNNLGDWLAGTGKPAETLAAYRKSLAIYQKLVDADPANTDVQNGLRWS